MRIELPREAQRFGANLFYGVQKVYELDSGPASDALSNSSDFVIQQISYETLNAIEKQMAIIVPMKNEKLRLLEGILFAIPHSCLTIVVSNSPREPVDRFNMEKNAIENFCRFTKKSIVVVHQKDLSIAAAFAAVGYEGILDDAGSVKDGKAEGMLLGLVLAHLAGKKYIGYVDADNYIPGAVFEYVRAYATGFVLSRSNYAMVRMLWHSKPKVVDSSLFFAKYGRASVITNDFLNRLISYHTGFETEVIKTGNAGEHALTTSLALLLDYAPGYAIEPYHYVNLLEKFGGVAVSPHPEVMRQGVDVYQIESRNPHLHASKGERHVQSMIYSSLQAIYHSTAVSETLKHEIRVEMRRRRLIGKDEEPAPLIRYPALGNIDFNKFAQAIDGQAFAMKVGNGA